MRLMILLITMLGTGLPAVAANDQPNILFIVAEDLGPRIGAYGDTVAQTPNLDTLATQSVRYSNVFAAAGVCAPNRSALISGMYPISMGTHQMRTSQLELPTGEKGYESVTPEAMKAFPELLRRAGYETLNFAKKDYQFGTPSTIWDQDIGNYFSELDPALWRKLSGDKPFFVMVNLMSTHEGHLLTEDGKAAPQFKGFTDLIAKDLAKVEAVTDPADVIVPPYYPDTPMVRRSLAQHYDNIHYMDSQVGEILQALKADGLDKNTIVVWTTDHGDALPRAKRAVYDSGLHIPLMIRFPDGKGANTFDDQLIGMVDFAPTFLDMAGAPKPGFLQGRSIFAEEEREYVFGARDRMDAVPDKVRAARDTRFKYLRNDMADIPYFRPLTFRDMFPVMISMWEGHRAGTLNAVQNAYFTGPRTAEELYDTEADPWEIHNLAGDPDYQHKLIELRNALTGWEKRVQDRSTIPELEMVEDMWPDYNQPVTQPPSFSVVRCGNEQCVALAADNNASIAYRLSPDQNWLLYTAPIKLDSSDKLSAKAIRYGFKESKVESYQHD